MANDDDKDPPKEPEGDKERPKLPPDWSGQKSENPKPKPR